MKIFDKNFGNFLFLQNAQKYKLKTVQYYLHKKDKQSKFVCKYCTQNLNVKYFKSSPTPKINSKT